jgi:predicted transcriptional regulator of viral defense system
MRNRANSKIGKIIEVVRKLPVFTLDNLASIETNKKYLRVLLSRHVKSGNVIRLKKGMYVTKDYLDQIEKSGRLHVYAEFLAGILHKPSYLSLEYVLHQHGVITEMPVAVTAIARKKTTSFKTLFGIYQYHSISPALFTGFTTKKDGDYLIYRASLAKALFDFLYFRKSHLKGWEVIEEMRLNLDMLTPNDKRELAKYVEREGSTRMKDVYELLMKK